MVRLHVLGGLEPRASAGTELLPVLTQPKRVALLAYLAIANPRGFHRRDKLLGLFWPELDEEHARGALSQAVYQLRRRLGDDVVVSRGKEELGVDPAALWCDAVAFEAALDARSERDALELYRGDLLAGFFLSDAPEWERWLEEERGRVRDRAAAAAWTLAQQAAADRNSADAAHWGRRALALGPSDEARLRGLMVLLDGLGDRAGAVRVYEESAKRLGRHYEIELAPETQALLAEMKARVRPVTERESSPARGGSGPAPATALAGEAGKARSRHPPGQGPRFAAMSHGSPADQQPTARGVTDGTVTRAGRRTRRVVLLAAAVLIAAVIVAGFLLWPPVRADDAAAEPAGEAGSLASSLEEQGIARPDAYAEYLKGRYFLAKLDADAFGEARYHFERSLDLDPTFAGAWSGLSHAYIHLTSMMVLPAGEAYPRARAAAERALELEPDLAEAHAALAMTLSMFYWDTDGAERHFRRALELEPSSARSHRLYAAHLRNLGRLEEALSWIRRSKELDPLFAFSYVEEGIILYMARQHDEALTKFQQYLRVVPGDTHVHVFIAMVHREKGQYEEALAALRETDPQMRRPDAQTIRGVVYARMGRHEDARQMLARLDELLSDQQPVSPFHKAAIHVALGEHDRAIELLQQAAEEPTWQMRLLKVSPGLEPLHTDPRFQALLAKVGLSR